MPKKASGDPAKGRGRGKGKGKDKGANAVEEETAEDDLGEVTTFSFPDVCQLSSNRPEVDKDGWIRCLLDSGCARTVFPMDADYGVSSKAVRKYKFATASGEIMESGDAYRVEGNDEYETDLALNGIQAPVHKPLVSAGAVADKDNDMWLSQDGGYIIRSGCAAHTEIRTAIDKILRKHHYEGTTTIYKERGVYNFYVKGRSGGVKAKTKDVCPQEELPQLGGPRRGKRP